MNIHEYQAKELFKSYGIPVSTGSVAYSFDEIETAVNNVNGPTWVVKAQIHAGGRGKGGGVKVVSSAGEAILEAKKMFGMNLITPQTGPGVTNENIKTIANSLELSGSLEEQLDGLIKNLYRFFVEKDASLLEINPLIITDTKKLICLDAKVNFDDNALYRHPEIEELRDPNEEDKYELEAAKYDLAYIKLDGSIGCMVNGAGLAMASLDIIKLYGGEPANFLDVGGGASKEKVTSAFKIILSDPGVKGILVNIFGGIMRCDIIADGIVAAAKELQINVPLVVRLEGTNVEEGKEILNNSGIDIVSATDLDDAAKKIVELV